MRRLWNLLSVTLSRFNIISNLALQNLALRQQLAVMQRNCRKPQIYNRDRFFWILLVGLCDSWKETLVIVKPETVIAWNCKGFKQFWRWVKVKVTSGNMNFSEVFKSQQ